MEHFSERVRTVVTKAVDLRMRLIGGNYATKKKITVQICKALLQSMEDTEDTEHAMASFFINQYFVIMQVQPGTDLSKIDIINLSKAALKIIKIKRK